eukprot:970421-Prorocentrum_minimum.AAC.2
MVLVITKGGALLSDEATQTYIDSSRSQHQIRSHPQHDAHDDQRHEVARHGHVKGEQVHVVARLERRRPRLTRLHRRAHAHGARVVRVLHKLRARQQVVPVRDERQHVQPSQPRRNVLLLDVEAAREHDGQHDHRAGGQGELEVPSVAPDQQAPTGRREYHPVQVQQEGNEAGGLERGVGELDGQLAERLGPEVRTQSVQTRGALPLDDHQLGQEGGEGVEQAEEAEEHGREEHVAGLLHRELVVPRKAPPDGVRDDAKPNHLEQLVPRREIAPLLNGCAFT